MKKKGEKEKEEDLLMQGTHMKWKTRKNSEEEKVKEEKIKERSRRRFVKGIITKRRKRKSCKSEDPKVSKKNL